jgi:heme/copper-type cytochrome/quinol oxidase subunit 2
MQDDTIAYDTLGSRPLPKWLTDQKSGANTIQPQKITMREDNSLKISFIATSIFILLAITILTIYILRKHKNQV